MKSTDRIDMLKGLESLLVNSQSPDEGGGGSPRAKYEGGAEDTGKSLIYRIGMCPKAYLDLLRPKMDSRLRKFILKTLQKDMDFKHIDIKILEKIIDLPDARQVLVILVDYPMLLNIGVEWLMKVMSFDHYYSALSALATLRDLWNRPVLVRKLLDAPNAYSILKIFYEHPCLLGLNHRILHAIFMKSAAVNILGFLGEDYEEWSQAEDFLHDILMLNG